MADQLILCLAALVAGMINSVAGGGTLLTFPALFGVLGPVANAGVLANGTSTVALWPGSVASTWGYRQEFRLGGRWMAWLLVPSILGGLAGALLVIAFPKLFNTLVPWLILTAALLFALQPRIARWTGIGQEHGPPTRRRLLTILAFQSLVALYGGYFGAGIGILMLSSLAMMGLKDIHLMNAVKNLCATCINGMAFAVFIACRKVAWDLVWPMLVSAVIGGYVGALLARRANREWVRRTVVAIGFSLAAFYFYRQFR